MTTIAAALLSWLLLYKYTLLFGVFFLSALARPLPGNTLLFATGAFASQGYMSYWVALLVALVGNVLGDVAGYALAAYYGDDVIRRLHIKRTYLAAVERYVANHPRVTIVLSRFGGSLDPVVNVLCGLGEVSIQTFIVFDIIGNLASLLMVLTAGYYFGDYWQTFSSFVSIIGWIAFVALAAAGLTVAFRKRLHITEPRFLRGMRQRLGRLFH